MKRILAIWLPNWPVQRLVSIRPELRGQAVILDQAARRGREVATCSPRARKLGVRPGMPVAEATALVRKADVALFVHSEAHDPQADRLALEKLAAWCQQYSPYVGLEETKGVRTHLPERLEECFAQMSPDPFCQETLLLDVTGIAPLFGGERAFIEQVAWGFQRLRLTVQLALSDTIGAAWAVSHYGCQNPLVTEVTIVEPSEKQRHEVEASQIQRVGSCAAVGELPLAALRLPPEMVETLGRLGLQQINELQLIPRVELQARFGTLLLKRLDQAFGAANEVIHCIQPPSDFTAQWLLEHPTDQREAIQTVIQRLVEQLALRLADCGEGALQLVCRMDVCSDTNPTRKREIENSSDGTTADSLGRKPQENRTKTNSSPEGATQRDASKSLSPLQGSGALSCNNPWGSRPRLPATAASRLKNAPSKPTHQISCETASTQPTTGVAGDEHSEALVYSGDGGSLRSTPATQHSFEVGLFRPSAEPRHLMELVNMQMEQVKLTGPVNCISVQVPRHARLEHRQQGLFDQGERKSESRQVSVLVDRLAGRLGREAVVRCVLQSDAQPELAYREEPLVDQSSQKRRAQSTRSFLSPLDRPLHLLREPLAIQVMAVAPAGPPIRFRYRNHDCQVARYWGPERVETGWWRRRGVQRDYYRVETKTGQRFWLFRQMRTGDWFLHGEFV